MRGRLPGCGQCGAIVYFVASWFLAPARAVEFRVETQIFRDGERTPSTRSTAYFRRDVMYDFLEDPLEITIFEPTPGKFTLLDTKRRIRTAVELDQLGKLVDELQTAMLKRPDSLARFAAQPRFDTNYDLGRRELTLTGKWMTYRVQANSLAAERGLDGAAPAYRKFADGYAKLNATRPGALLPFARLALNEALARRDLVPREVRLELAADTAKIGGKSDAKPTVVRSEHRYQWRLDEADSKRLAEVEELRRTYRSLTVTEYYRETARSGK